MRTVSDKDHLGPEGYELTVLKNRVLVEAADGDGRVLRRARHSANCCPPPSRANASTVGVDWTVPCVEIEDKPRYRWRGLMLDPGHNFLTKEFTKRYIDVMAFYKMNRLHWHLTDMGWAIEIKKYPELTNIEKWPAVAPRWRRAYGKCTHGFYTQDDVREIVAYAAERHVTIVPEIELPAHSSAALACYPELRCPNCDEPEGAGRQLLRLSEQLLCRQREDVRVSRRRALGGHGAVPLAADPHRRRRTDQGPLEEVPACARPA